MPKFKWSLSIVAIVAVCTLGNSSFAKPAAKLACGLNGNYSFFFWDPGTKTNRADPGFGSNLAGVGFFSVQVDPATDCRSGVVLPGGIFNCNIGFSDNPPFEDFIESGSVFLETDGEGTMVLETNSSDGICRTGKNALELDISVVLGGKTVLLNSNGVENAQSGTTPNAGYDVTLTGRADRCFAGQISGCYDVRFWNTIPDEDYSAVGDCTICVNGAGAVTGGTCRCTRYVPDALVNKSTTTLSEIEFGGYTLGENCQSSTGYLWFATSSDPICGQGSYLALDFAVAQQGDELIGACDTEFYILNDESEPNAGYWGCTFEGWKQ
jgi:hypothetical protein